MIYITIVISVTEQRTSGPSIMDLMDSYKTVVMEYLRADSSVFVNADCRIRMDETKGQKKNGFHLRCDAIAVDFRHHAVYLCEIAVTQGLRALIKRLGAWTENWEEVKDGLRRDCRLPSEWRVYVWLFIPRESIEMLDAKLEELRSTFGSAFKVKITALEDVQPWRSGAWV